LLAGVSTEPGLGHFLIYGLGGVHTELLSHVDLLPIPSSPEFIRSSVAASLVGRVLATRNDGDRLMEQFCAILGKLQRLALHFSDTIDSIDINPILLGKEGCIGVDALIVKT
jgi:hypothetical protein